MIRCGEDDDIDTLLMEYACGALDQALALVAASYVTISPAARARLRRCETLGGLLMQDCDPVPMSGRSLEAVLYKIGNAPGGGAAAPPCAGRTAEETGDKRKPPLPDPLRRHMEECGCAAPRWRTVMPGLAVMALPVSACSRHRIMLVRSAPGTKIPQHRHEDAEIALILQGGYADEYGTYRAGDLAVYPGGTVHRPAADPAAGCVALVASGEPVRFTGFFARIFGPVFLWR